MRKHKVLDLFCGMGGLSYGFAKDPIFSVLGVDNDEWVRETYPEYRKASSLEIKFSPVASRKKYLHANIGNFKRTLEQIEKNFGHPEIILGGPPCKPFSTYNLTRRKSSHLDYKQLKNYFNYVKHYEPEIFILENVPALKSDIGFQKLIKNDELNKKYCIQESLINYHDYGASTSRTRLFVIGLKDKHHFMENNLFAQLEKRKLKNKPTLTDSIGFLKDKEKDLDHWTCRECKKVGIGLKPKACTECNANKIIVLRKDHTWPEFKTIHKYYKFYKTEKYGWYILKWDKPSPSLGNVTKTYVLHPNIDEEITPIFDNIAKFSLIKENYRTSPKISPAKLEEIIIQNKKKSKAEKQKLRTKKLNEIRKAKKHLQEEGRVLSVKELSLIMGFDRRFSFSPNIPVNARYQMIVDSVSPKFSLALAATVKKIL